MQKPRAIESVCVVGAGIVGLSAATAFARALPKTRVHLIRTPPDPAALADRIGATLPTIHRFHALIGLDELDLISSGIATHRLGTRFEHWSADDRPWYHVFGDYGLNAEGVPFHQLWVRARLAEEAPPFHQFAAAAVLAEAGKFVHPSRDPASLLSSYLYALRLDPQRYRERMESQLTRLPVARSQGAVAGVDRRGDGGVAAITLDQGERIEADLFIDCAGPAAPVASSVSGGFEEWSESLPCDRLLLAEEAGAELIPYDFASAVPLGWRWRSPRPDHVGTGFAYASSVNSEEEARRAAGGAAGQGEAVAVRPGRRKKPWKRNVLAIGDAAAAIDPLQSTNLYLAHSAIERALALLPGRDCHPLELREYNRQSTQEAERVRDFVALHYLRSGRTEGLFWSAMARRPLPETLANTVEQFEVRGRLPFYEEESFDQHDWHAVLLGMGVVPREANPVADGIDREAAAAGMRRLMKRLQESVERLPPYSAYLAEMVARGRR